MPFSTAKFKDETRELLIKKFPRTARVLDVGPGSGIYSDLLSDWFYEINCVEIWKPYIEKFNLRSKYGTVHTIAFQDMILASMSYDTYDIVIMGDVLEHMDLKDAQYVLKKVEESGSFVVVAVPYDYAQGEEMGNPYEAHQQSDLNPETIKERYPQLALYAGDNTMGVYCFKSMFDIKAEWIGALESPEKIATVPDRDAMVFLMDWGRKQVIRHSLRELVGYGIKITHPKSADQDITYV